MRRSFVLSEPPVRLIATATPSARRQTSHAPTPGVKATNPQGSNAGSRGKSAKPLTHKATANPRGKSRSTLIVKVPALGVGS